MFRFTTTYVGRVDGEIIPPGDGWLFVSCALDQDSDKLVIVWKRDPLIEWKLGKNTHASIPELSRAGEEPV